MRTTSLCVLVSSFALCHAASSQGPIFTLPRGYEAMGGGWSNGAGVSYPFDQPNFRYMEVHSTIRGTSRVMTTMRARRGWGIATNTTAIAHTCDLTLNVGPGTITAFTTTFSTNFSASPTQVFAKTSFSMPDWRTLSGQVPDAWTVVLTPFSSPYFYGGTTDFVWDLVRANGSIGTGQRYLSDRTSSTGNSPTQNPRQGDRVSYGTGCIATGRTAAMTHTQTMYNSGPLAPTNPMRMNVTSTNNPSNTPVQMAIGIPLQIQVPGWCAPVYINPLIFVGLGMTNATGALAAAVDFNSPTYIPSLVYQSITTQTFAADAGQASGLVLSNAATAFMPRDPGDDLFKYIYTATLTSATGSGPFTAGSVVTGWN